MLMATGLLGQRGGKHLSLQFRGFYPHTMFTFGFCNCLWDIGSHWKWDLEFVPERTTSVFRGEILF